MKSTLLLLAATLFFVSCERIDGQLNITKDLPLVSSDGNSHSLKVGTYTADLRSSAFGKKIILRLSQDASLQFNFNVPKGTKIPDNGTFKLTSAQVGQKVDLTGVVKTDFKDSEVREGYGQCTYTEPYTVCMPSGPQGQVSCTTSMRTVYGTEWQRYYDRVANQDFTLSIAEKNASVESAQFLGATSWSERIIVSRSGCH